MTPAILAAVLVGVGTLLAVARPRVRSPVATPRSEPAPQPASGARLRRHRSIVVAASAAAGPAWLGSPGGWLAGGVVAAAVWVGVGRLDGEDERRRRSVVARELPHVVLMLGLVLASGASVRQSLRRVVAVLPGPATASLRTAESRLAVGVAAAEVWAALARDRGLERLGRALARAERSGAPVAELVARLAEELAEEYRAGIEDRARSVGVRAALPLGLCLLPAFLLVGIAPIVATALDGLPW